jgi:hypothetical protein
MLYIFIIKNVIFARKLKLKGILSRIVQSEGTKH